MTGKVGLEGRYVDAELKGWLWKFCKKNYWKVQSWYEFDDLIQDGCMVYAKCLRSFKPRADIPTDEAQRNFMAYFQRAMGNHMTELQQPERTWMQVGFRDLSEDQLAAVEDKTSLWDDGQNALGDLDLISLLARAPAEIADMLKKILVDGVLEIFPNATKMRLPIAPGKRKTLAVRETTSEHIDRCLGQPGAAAKLREFLTSS